ncbi:X-ray repair cross-complementing protein 5 [Palaemon carinicauda]|uniref:X-ray repair cross-complementing protein 5 n=1 Tax=Palaemon carinicauda TaxID=392227 RepID=UPI0035B5AE95
MTEFEYDADDNLGEDDEEGGSWTFGGRTASVFLIDASPAMFDSQSNDEGDDNDPPFQKAIKCVHATLMRKIITSDQDLISVVFFNTRETKNSTDFANVYILQDLERPGAEKILQLEELLKLPTKEFDKKYGHASGANIHDALRVCQGIFTKSSSRLSGQSIMLFTNCDDPHPGDNQKQRQARQKAGDLKEAGIVLEILHMGNHFDVKKFYQDMIIRDDEDEDSQESMILADPTNRIDELTDRVKRLEHKQRTMGRTTFTLAPGVEMAVSIYTGVRKTYKPSKVKLWKTTNEEVRYMKKEYLEETGELLLPSDYVKYQEYGKKKIKFTLDEVRSLSSIYPPGIELLGFKSIKCIKPYMHVKPANFVYVDDKTIEGSKKMFGALLDRCLAREVVPIVRFIPRRNASVAWAALIPQAEELDEHNCQVVPPGFHACFLPFADDFRNLEMENLPRATPDQVDAAKAVIQKLHFKYQPESFDNPSLQTHWRNIEALALNRSTLDPVPDHTVPTNDRILRKVGKLLDNLRDLVYPPSYDPANPPKKRPSAASTPAPKKPKIDPKSMSVEDLAKEGKVDKLNMDQLKAWLQERGMRVTGKKKAQLVQDVMDELGV